MLTGQSGKTDAWVFFDVTDYEVLSRLDKRRWLGHRADDDPKAIATRLSAYREQTAPVLAWFASRGPVHTIPAAGAVDVIASRVRSVRGREGTRKPEWVLQSLPARA